MNLDQLETILGHKFKDINLLDTALSHRSYLNESKKPQSNERLEFLGDAVLELLVSEYLFDSKPDEPEGVLTAARSAMVRTETLAKVAAGLTLGEFLHMSKGEEKTGGRTNTSLLANTTEAVIGAIFKDGGIQAASTFVDEHILPIAQEVLAEGLKDPKSLLQETVQEKGFTTPVYYTVEATGPDHDKMFVVAVDTYGKKQLALGKGKSKQAAQQDAAKKALEIINSDSQG